MKYKIVKSNLDDLEEKVSRAIEGGYKPLGAPVWIRDGNYTPIFAQAMVLKSST